MGKFGLIVMMISTMYPTKGPVNIYGNTGPRNEWWPVVKFDVAPLILPYKIVYGPVYHQLAQKFTMAPLKSPSEKVVGPVV